MTTDQQPDDEALDDLAAYATDALDHDERLRLETTLLTDQGCEQITAGFQEAAVEYAFAADASMVVPPAPELRRRVLEAAFDTRPPVAVVATAARDTHLIETERYELLISRLDEEQMSRILDVPELNGWSVKDLHAHLSSNEALLAQALGNTIDVPETDDSNDGRTMEVIRRHREMATPEVLDEYRRARLAADTAVAERGDEGPDTEITFWGRPMRAHDALVLRAFETWIHADDIRRAVGLPMVPPAAPVIKTMSVLASRWLPPQIAACTPAHHDKSILLDLTGAGGGRFHVSLGDPERDLTAVTPDAVLHVDVVAFCHGVGRRAFLHEDEIAYEADGDTGLAVDVMAKIDLIAVL